MSGTVERGNGNGNGWAAWEKKVLGDLERLEHNQIKIFQKLEEHAIDSATQKARISMIAGGIAIAISIVTQLLTRAGI